MAVQANRTAFEWGRCAAHDLEMVRRIAYPDANKVVELKRIASSLEDIVARRVEFLTGYQNAAYARRYSDLVERVRRVESDRLQSTLVAEAVARSYFKVLAYKDEYEVARLHADPAFGARIASQFEGDYKLNFHLAPPLLARPDPATGQIRKMQFGPWMMPVFRILAKLKGLRGTPLDIFGYTAERRSERALIAEYEALVDEVLTRLSADNHAVAVELARLPQEIRGFGHIRAASLAARKDPLVFAAFETARPVHCAGDTHAAEGGLDSPPSQARLNPPASTPPPCRGRTPARQHHELPGEGRDAHVTMQPVAAASGSDAAHQAERLTALAREARLVELGVSGDSDVGHALAGRLETALEGAMDADSAQDLKRACASIEAVLGELFGRGMQLSAQMTLMDIDGVLGTSRMPVLTAVLSGPKA